MSLEDGKSNHIPNFQVQFSLLTNQFSILNRIPSTVAAASPAADGRFDPAETC
jgi:hypothetical protein